MNFYLNNKNSFRNLTDIEFENILPTLAQELEDDGFIYHSYNLNELKKDWKSLCDKQPTDTIVETALESLKTLESLSYQNIVIPATNTLGMKIIRQFMPHFYNVKNYKGISVLSLWKKENLEKALIFNRKYHSTPYVSEIIRSLSFTNGLGKITIYRPLMAKTIVQYFQAQSILDVCTGWGGRMLGSSCAKVCNNSNVQYTGIEPCLKTYQGLCNIRDTLSLQNVELINETAEKALTTILSEERKFDLALTSPPYYNLEIYSDESTQSLQYGNYDTWIKQFLEPVICEILKRVKYSCWSVKNFKTDKKYNLLTDVIMIHEKYGWIMLNITFSMKNSKRPGGCNINNNNNENNENNENKSLAEETTYVFVCKPTTL